jgi:hypothetical protein
MRTRRGWARGGDQTRGFGGIGEAAAAANTGHCQANWDRQAAVLGLHQAMARLHIIGGRVWSGVADA